MNDGTLIYVLTTRVGDEDAQVWTYSTRDAAEQAIRLVAEREHGDLVTGLAAPPTAIDDCITMLVRDCGYRDVRLTQTELGLDPGDYDPEDLYLPPELIPA